MERSDSTNGAKRLNLWSEATLFGGVRGGGSPPAQLNLIATIIHYARYPKVCRGAFPPPRKFSRDELFESAARFKVQTIHCLIIVPLYMGMPGGRSATPRPPWVLGGVPPPDPWGGLLRIRDPNRNPENYIGCIKFCKWPQEPPQNSGGSRGRGGGTPPPGIPI